MTSTMQLQKRKRSKILNKLLAGLAPDFEKLQTKVDAVFEQARKEGFPDMEIGGFVRSQLEVNYSSRTIQRVLPDTAKHLDHTSPHRKSASEPDKMSGSEHEKAPLEMPGDKVKVSKSSQNIDPKYMEGVDNGSYLPGTNKSDYDDDDKLEQKQPENSGENHPENLKSPTPESSGPQPTTADQAPESSTSSSDEPKPEQQPIKVNYTTLKEIDSYDEQHCKDLLKQILPEYLKQRDLKRDLETSREHSRKQASELDKLKFKFKLCNDWPTCKSKGVYRQSYNEYTDSESWLCDKHRKQLAEIGKMAGKVLSKALGGL